MLRDRDVELGQVRRVEVIPGRVRAERAVERHGTGAAAIGVHVTRNALDDVAEVRDGLVGVGRVLRVEVVRVSAAPKAKEQYVVRSLSRKNTRRV
jgi:hypothetical protein